MYMNKKLIADSGNSTRGLKATFYDAVQLTYEYRWLSALREKIIKVGKPWDSFTIAACDGLIQKIDVRQVSILIYNGRTKRLMLVGSYGKVPNDQLSSEQDRIFSVYRDNGDHSTVIYDRHNAVNSCFSQADVVPGTSEYKHYRKALKNLKPVRAFKGVPSPFVVMPYKIDDVATMLVEIHHESLPSLPQQDLLGYSLLCDAIFSQVRNRLLLDRVKFNYQDLAVTDRAVLPQRGLSVSLLGVNDCQVMEKIRRYKDIVDSFHIDVMDGQYVEAYQVFDIHGEQVRKGDFPFITSQLIHQIKSENDVMLDAHLMVQDPVQYIIEYALAGVDVITISYEPDAKRLREYIGLIHSLGKVAGLAIRPETTLEEIEDLLQDVDLVLIMTVPPGKGGQKFDTEMLTKIKDLQKLILSRNLHLRIQVDGGITEETGPQTISAGANFLVSGTALLKSPDPEKTARIMLGN